jgi:hypothetical protein
MKENQCSSMCFLNLVWADFQSIKQIGNERGNEIRNLTAESISDGIGKIRHIGSRLASVTRNDFESRESQKVDDPLKGCEGTIGPINAVSRDAFAIGKLKMAINSIHDCGNIELISITDWRSPSNGTDDGETRELL